jgi:hypothetical protein
MRLGPREDEKSSRIMVTTSIITTDLARIGPVAMILVHPTDIRAIIRGTRVVIIVTIVIMTAGIEIREERIMMTEDRQRRQVHEVHIQ